MTTIYDDVFKTMISGPKYPLLKLINEIFHTDYTGKEKIQYYDKEFIYPDFQNNFEKRLSDSSFSIEKDGISKHYHIECQTNADDAILIRIFEYDIQIAFRHHKMKDHELSVVFPESAVLFLRNPKEDAKQLKISFTIDGQQVTHCIKVIRISDYNLNDIIEKQLYFLIPFYIFNYDHDLRKIDKDKEKITQITHDFTVLIDHLNEKMESGDLDSFSYYTIVEMMRDVVESYTKRYNNIRREVKQLMNGKIIEYQARTDYMEGLREGHKNGLEEGHKNGLKEGREEVKISFPFTFSLCR